MQKAYNLLTEEYKSFNYDNIENFKQRTATIYNKDKNEKHFKHIQIIKKKDIYI